MGYYEHKTKEELLEIVEKLEKKVEGLSSELDSLKKGRFSRAVQYPDFGCFARYAYCF